MSTTIGIGYSTIDDSEIYPELKLIAEKFGYGLLNGVEHSESNVRSGLEIMQKNENWMNVLFLQFPIDDDIGLAFGIHEELTAFEVSGDRPKFFDFLAEVSRLASQKCKKLGFFFAGEWLEGDRVRYSYGNIDRLITLLSLPGNWGIRYMIPQTGRLQDSDEIPFTFDLNLK
ncbi:hypothetical protein [Marinimicrobium alkaliphilum]|uniref:hypothetical protein n=1 Tax=Marinimicrobium alkaliphilum TaxID=2202654 RepID=UPI000DB97FA0|nr:hypothetical protein [Marinimicrobium alkaliphilum]